MKPRIYKSKIVEKIFKEMELEPWYTRLARYIRVHWWIIYYLYLRKK